MTIIQRGNAFRWSQAIPVRLRARFDCGTSIQKSLTTRDRAVAHSYATYLSETAGRLFRLADAHPHLTGREIKLLVRNLQNLTETIETREGDRYYGRYLEDDLKAALENDAKAHPSPRELAALRQHLRSLTEEIDRALRLEPAGAEPDNRGATRLSAVALRFLQERRLNTGFGISESRRGHLRTFLLIAGDQPIDKIDRSDLAYFKDVIQRLPARWEHTYPGVPISEILAKEHIGGKLQPETVNGYIATVHAFFEWAYVNGYVPFNPARKLKIRIKRRPQDQRKRFHAGDLRQIFEESQYFSRKSDPRSVAARKTDPKAYHMFWIPLIALYSGLRAAEVVGLERQDLRREDGTWCFVIRPNSLRDLKSLSAHRNVPIHPVLLQMGIVDSIGRQGFRDRDSVWPALPKLGRRVAASFARIWGEYKRSAGIDDPRKTFHSFRHTFVHALAEIEPQFAIVADLAGHAMKSEFYGRYRKRPDARLLYKTIRRLTFPVRLDHLMPRPGTRLARPATG